MFLRITVAYGENYDRGACLLHGDDATLLSGVVVAEKGELEPGLGFRGAGCCHLGPAKGFRFQGVFTTVARSIGMAEKAVELASATGFKSHRFWSTLLKFGRQGERIAMHALPIDQPAYWTPYAQWEIDIVGVKHAIQKYLPIKVAGQNV